VATQGFVAKRLADHHSDIGAAVPGRPMQPPERKTALRRKVEGFFKDSRQCLGGESAHRHHLHASPAESFAVANQMRAAIS
jgi:hypothetical protein